MYGTVTSIVTTTGNHNTITTLSTHKNLPSSHLTFNISFFGCSITTATLLPPIVCAVPITYLPKLNTRCEKIANLWEVAVTYRLVGGGCGEWWWYTGSGGDGNGNRDAHDKEIQFMMMTSRVHVFIQHRVRHHIHNGIIEPSGWKHFQLPWLGSSTQFIAGLSPYSAGLWGWGTAV